MPTTVKLSPINIRTHCITDAAEACPVCGWQKTHIEEFEVRTKIDKNSHECVEISFHGECGHGWRVAYCHPSTETYPLRHEGEEPTMVPYTGEIDWGN